jgi:hypothetical protein
MTIPLLSLVLDRLSTLRSDERGAVGWLILGVVIGVILVIVLIVQLLIPGNGD